MNSNRKTAATVGALFLIAMVASLVGGGLVESVISVPDTFTAISENETLLTAGILLELVNAIAVVGIGVLMFTVLKRHNETLATGYLSLRIVEAVFCSVIVVSPLSLIRLSEEYATTGADTVHLNMAGALSIAERASVSGLLVPVFFSLGCSPALFLAVSIETPAAIYIGLGLCRRHVDIDIEFTVGYWLGSRHGNKHDLRPPHHLE